VYGYWQHTIDRRVWQEGVHRLVSQRADGVRSIVRALEILALLTPERPALTIKEMTEATGLPRTTVVRIAQTLENNGLLWPTPTHYTAGPGMLRWSYLARQGWELPPEAQKAMRDLADRRGETVNLFIARDVNRVCVAQQESPHPLRHVVYVGDEQPLWGGASSKILLRDAPQTLLDRVALSSPGGVASAPLLREAAHEAARRGYAVSHSEHDEGLSAVAVPVLDRTGATVASLSLSGPTTRFPASSIPDLVTDLHRLADFLGERTYGRP
jgi:DNA-binding IclR family transcriptional regulator